ncbi:programmed cell death 1 ligand 1-like [Anabas testudineus]|uniref:programmed cell death 1 ligand 1-like n=1 Tax=Anabas testudineus TaxID=64144 RepID=UPI000E45FE32|nr:programmed cell death 1 ligand 1-like [Anabas testudineus]
MSVYQRLSLCCLFSCFLLRGSSEDVKGKPGADVTLQCKSPRDDQILLLRWSRPDLGSNEYVIYFRQNRLNEDYQHERFRGRVKLKDPNMKDGDFSVILKNVTVRDTGTYECSVGYGGNPELINTINLTVEPGDAAEKPGNEGDRDEGSKDEGDRGNTAVIVVVVLVLLLVVVGIVGFWFYKKRRASEQHSYQQPPAK